MEKLITTKDILKALYTCASKEDTRQHISGFFILPDRRVYSTDGCRLVVIRHDSFEKLPAGAYTFLGKPAYNKGLGEIIIEKANHTGPDIDPLLKDLDKQVICRHVFVSDKADYALNISCLLAKIFNGYKAMLNYALLDFFPAGEGFAVTTADLIVPNKGIKFTLNTSRWIEFSAVVMPIRWNEVKD